MILTIGLSSALSSKFKVGKLKFKFEYKVKHKKINDLY